MVSSQSPSQGGSLPKWGACRCGSGKANGSSDSFRWSDYSAWLGRDWSGTRKLPRSHSRICSVRQPSHFRRNRHFYLSADRLCLCESGAVWSCHWVFRKSFGNRVWWPDCLWIGNPSLWPRRVSTGSDLFQADRYIVTRLWRVWIRLCLGSTSWEWPRNSVSNSRARDPEESFWCISSPFSFPVGLWIAPARKGREVFVRS